MCQKKEATYCVDKNPDVHPDLTERLALVIAVHVEIVEQIVREVLVGLGGRFGGLTDLAASGEARALCVRYDVVYEYEIIDIAGSIDRLALRGMLEDGVGKDRQRAVACPMPESAAGETEAISIQHDAHVGLVAATVARLRCAAVHTRLERNVRFSILGGLETRDFDERPAAPAQRYRVICRGQVYDPEETVWSEHQGQATQSDVLNPPWNGKQIDGSTVGDEAPERCSVLGDGADSDDTQGKSAVTSDVLENSLPDHASNLGP